MHTNPIWNVGLARITGRETSCCAICSKCICRSWFLLQSARELPLDAGGDGGFTGKLKKRAHGSPGGPDSSHRRLKLLFGDGLWVCYRLSGTEPVVRVYSEAWQQRGTNKVERGRETMDLRIKRPEIRVLPHAQRGLSALVERAPQAEAFGRRVGHRIGSPIGRAINRKLHPAFAWLYRARRRLATAAVAVVTVWLFLHVMFGANGMVVYRQKRAEYQNQPRDRPTAKGKRSLQSRTHRRSGSSDSSKG